MSVVGFGGLTSAIECHRQGHTVEVYESFPGIDRSFACEPSRANLLGIELKPLGDIISFGSNGGRIFRRWSNGVVADRLRSLSIDLLNHGFKIHKWTGELVYTQPTPKPDPDAPVFNGHRGELHMEVFKYAEDELGIPIHLGHRVVEYSEDENEAVITLDNGQTVLGVYVFLFSETLGLMRN